ncbi:GDP-mannose 4,6-dehydratase [Sphingomonas sp. AR_OL41]|uniref:GDP-mannose 4,6-dehydratase n=1 Tax=Sphingomonas sp. AR_OL41 TaxID=3042729 RepID=UPI0024804F1B|nr:GDP-mannose 4,6-dehydratase [Sphingomonas sp. AR_OL41]MDH7972892.1 GDP-mannose 4,6-dehydratase [Sphingomonas sp. AR_OL41]
MTKRALICGISGQDGAYLARLLVDKGYQVFGTSRNIASADLSRLAAVGVGDQVTLCSATLSDFRSILTTLAEIRPSEVYNLSGQSSVGLSFGQPVETIESITVSTINLIEAIRFLDPTIRLYNAGSSECFGDTVRTAATEETPFQPRSPYGVAKSAAHWIVRNYREAYGVFGCTGILFNHESPLRPRQFVTRKIVDGACAIKQGRLDRLTLGNLDITRDWGWAPEYVVAMWSMLQGETADDYVVATGKACSLAEFVARAFAVLDLDWRDHVDIDKATFRPLDISYNCGDASKASAQLGWRAETLMPDVVDRMVAESLARLPHG